MFSLQPLYEWPWHLWVQFTGLKEYVFLWVNTTSITQWMLLILFILWWCTVLLLVPTRELALQTSQVCKELAKHLNIQIMVSTGGTSLRDDIMRLYQPVHMLVGTPGRILDLVNKGVCTLHECTMLVMDEVRIGSFIYSNSGLMLFLLTQALGQSFTLKAIKIKGALWMLLMVHSACQVQKAQETCWIDWSLPGCRLTSFCHQSSSHLWSNSLVTCPRIGKYCSTQLHFQLQWSRLRTDFWGNHML